MSRSRCWRGDFDEGSGISADEREEWSTNSSYTYRCRCLSVPPPSSFIPFPRAWTRYLSLKAAGLLGPATIRGDVFPNVFETLCCIIPEL